ncbi:MAG: prolyl oligopeptidase family serine peptidase [Verrucomicrobia bacterium]|nr:prolyl oligopeptidase family serine peptidase [Verrucomicrobiota bacterium]
MHNYVILSFILAATRLLAADPTPGKQVEQTLKLEGKEISYLLYLPANYSATSKVPLMLFLHGRGESQGPLSVVAKWGLPARVEHGYAYPFVIASPQCPTNEFWDQANQQQLLLGLLDHLVKTMSIDADRVYLTGLSMGGYGSWRLAADHPERFAAVVPICGAGNPADAEKLKQLPIWAFHGNEDRVVPLQKSQEMVEAITKSGGAKVRFTILEHIGHHSWDAAYASPDLYEWLARQTASQNKLPK